MKIFKRDEFLKLPADVMFRQGKPWVFDTLCIKGDTIFHDGKPIDFLYLELGDVEASDGGEWATRLHVMEESRTSFDVNEHMGRDGRFDDDMLFLVLEDDDVFAMYQAIGACLMTFTRRKPDAEK